MVIRVRDSGAVLPEEFKYDCLNVTFCDVRLQVNVQLIALMVKRLKNDYISRYTTSLLRHSFDVNTLYKPGPYTTCPVVGDES